VQSCREKDVLALINGKSTLVNPLACRCRGDCERNCVSGAMKLVEYGSKLKVRAPRIDENFESNVKGIYIVGSLTGAGLIKEAINQGRAAVNHIMKGVFPPDLPTVLVVGAGPAGLSAMLSCRKFGLPVLCFEKDRTANTVCNFPKKKIVMAEPVEMPLVGPLWVGDTTREKLLEAWEGILSKAGACIMTDSRLEKIESKDGCFLVTISGKGYACDKVILALGNRGVPRKLGVPGENGANVFYNLLEADEFSGSTVTVTGAGDSAIEAALALQRNGCRVTLVVRGTGFTKAKARNIERIERAIAAAEIRVHFSSRLLEIGDDFIVFTSDHGIVRQANESVFVLVGGELPFELLERIGIEIVEIEI
jgi:thioredoxin reductase